MGSQVMTWDLVLDIFVLRRCCYTVGPVCLLRMLRLFSCALLAESHLALCTRLIFLHYSSFVVR